MKANFLFKSEFSVIGTIESAICGINIGHEVPFTGAIAAVESFGITAEELAVFAPADTESIHFEREVVYVPLRGTRLNDKTSTEEISVLTVRAVADGEVVKSTQISRVLCRW